MQLTSNFAALALALGTISASALPSPSGSARSVEIPLTRRSERMLTRSDGSADLNKTTQELAHLKAKYTKNFANYQRNTGKKHPLDATHKIQKRGTGQVPLGDQAGGELWTGKIAFGSPPQSIYIDFDTGSSDTLVNPGAYNPSSSSTSSDTGTQFEDGYGDGTEASGEVYQDKLTWGGLSADTAYIGLSQSQFIGGSGEGNNQGISGMAFPSLSSFEQQTPAFYSLINAGVLDQEAFIIKLRTSGSSLTLGTKSDSATYVPLTDASYWSINAQINSQNIAGIVDSGTTVIVAPTDEARTFFSSLGLQTFTQDKELLAAYDCSNPPSVSFTFGSKTISLSQDTVSFGTTDNGQCVLSVVGSDVGASGWIIGDSLFQNTVVSFDVANQQVGFE